MMSRFLVSESDWMRGPITKVGMWGSSRLRRVCVDSLFPFLLYVLLKRALMVCSQ